MANKTIEIEVDQSTLNNDGLRFRVHGTLADVLGTEVVSVDKNDFPTGQLNKSEARQLVRLTILYLVSQLSTKDHAKVKSKLDKHGIDVKTKEVTP